MFREQDNMNDCIVCSKSNPASLRARFYNVAPGVVEGIFAGRDIHASYKGRMHGGIIAAVLDEAMGRALWTDRPEQMAVTAKMEVTYVKPCPLEIELKCVGRIVEENEKRFNAEAEIILPDGSVVAKSTGVYVFQSQEQIERVLREQ